MPQTYPPRSAPQRPPRPEFLEIGRDDDDDIEGFGQEYEDEFYGHQPVRHTPRQTDPAYRPQGRGQQQPLMNQRPNTQDLRHRPQQPTQDPRYRPQPQAGKNNFPRYPEDYGANATRTQRGNGYGQQQKKNWRTWVALAGLIPALGIAITIDAPSPILNWLVAIISIVVAGVFAWRKEVIKPRGYNR